MNPATKERRRLPRIRRRARVSFVLEGERHDGTIVNFSEMGLFVVASVLPKVGSEISIPLKIRAGESLGLSGRVMWAKKNSSSSDGAFGFGVELHAVPPEYLSFIHRMYDQLSARDPKSSERFDVYHKVRFRSKQEFLVEYIENLSRGGMYLATTMDLETGSTIRAQIEIDGIGMPIEVEGRVAYNLESDEAYEVGRNRGVGVQFVNLSAEAKAKIDHYIRRLEIHRLNPKRKNTSKLPDQGSLTDHLVPEILIDLYDRRFTGMLLLERHQTQKVVYFKQGQPIYVESNLNTETLGRYLVRQGKITSEDLEQSLEELAHSDAHHGEIMVRGGMIDQASLAEALVAHQEEKITNTFSWFDGTYSFEKTEYWPKNISILPLRPYHILFSGIETWYEPSLIHTWMGLDAGTQATLSAYGNLAFELPAVARQAMLHLYAPTDLRTLSKQLGLSLDRVVPWVFGFVLCGWVDLDFSDAKPKAPRTEPHPAVTPTPPQSKEAVSLLRKWLKEDFNRLKSLNYFDLFGLTPQASEVELTKAYMKWVARYSSKEITDIEDAEFKKDIEMVLSWIKLGYDTLRDSQLRQLYLSEKKPSAKGSAKSERIECEKLLLSSIRAIEQSDTARAISLLEEGCARFPKNTGFPGYLGWALFLKDPKAGYGEAVLRIDRAMIDDPSDAQLRYFRGELYAYAEEPKKAETCFLDALRLFPRFVKAQAALELIQEKLAT